MRRLVFAAVLLAALLAPASPAGAVVPKPVVPAINPWKQVSERSGKNLDESSAVRAADGTLHVVYTDDVGISNEGIRYRTLSKAGKWSTPETVVAGWVSANNPDIELIGGVPHVFWGGQRSTDVTDPASSGRAWYAARGADGAWTLSAAPLTQLSTPYASSQFSTALAADGTLWGAWTGTFGLRVHSGLAQGTAEEQSLSDGCCDYGANLGRDAATGDIYSVFYSNADSGEGYYTRRVAPSLGDRVLLAGGRYGNDALSRDKRLAAAPRTTGGVYAAFCDRYPSCTGVRVASVVGQGLHLRLPGTANPESVWTAAAPFGRMWVTWADSRGVWAVRSNKALTAWGAMQQLGGPKGWDGVWQTSGEGSTGNLDVFANVSIGDDFRIWHQRVRPKLSVTPLITLSKNNLIRIVKLRLTDAGDPVVGKIAFRGETHGTDALGYTTFIVPAGARVGAVPAIGTATGYVPGRATVRITR